MTAGDLALARHRNLQPHRRVSLSIVARLFHLAGKLGRLAVGLELRPSQSDKHPPDAFSPWNMNVAEALRRAYGGPVKAGLSPAPPP